MPELHLPYHILANILCDFHYKKKNKAKSLYIPKRQDISTKLKIHKTSSQRNIAYANINQASRTIIDYVLQEKVFDIAEDSSLNGYQKSLDSLIYNYFDGKTKRHLKRVTKLRTG